MGAQYQEMRLHGDLATAEVQNKFQQAQEQDRYENGHIYSGGFGMATGLEFVAGSRTFPRLEDASKWLQENAQKWRAALAVRAKDGREMLWETTYPYADKEHHRGFAEPVKTGTPNPNFGKEYWVIGAVCSS